MATNCDDGSYATKDLFEPHPTIPNAWRYYARLDDTLVLENGEKANPLIAEGVIRQSEHVAEAIVFGANKPRLGAFVVPSATTQLADEALLDAVMAYVNEANQVAPSFAYLSREMIKVLPRDVEFRKTDKGTVIRAAFYRDFSSQIEAAYADEQSGTLVLSKDDLLGFLRNEFSQRVLLKEGESFDDNTDLFSLGVDSLQAIQARSNIIKTLKVQAKDIGRNFVFDFPTLDEMANEILRLQHGAPKRVKLNVEARMAAMVEKYAEFEQHQPVDKPADGAYIVSTSYTHTRLKLTLPRLSLVQQAPWVPMLSPSWQHSQPRRKYTVLFGPRIPKTLIQEFGNLCASVVFSTTSPQTPCPRLSPILPTLLTNTSALVLNDMKQSRKTSRI